MPFEVAKGFFSRHCDRKAFADVLRDVRLVLPAARLSRGLVRVTGKAI
jgi:hypothetical protein